MDKTVVELFAGVGGFRVGLNNITKIDKDGRAIEHGNFNVVWADQWEPSTKSQPAFDCYTKRFKDNNCVNEDINLVDKKGIPNHTLLVGGFPCQDYSVARSLSNEKGIEGKKGVLWWQIRDILEEKQPPFVLLENVDRLIKSPAKQRGRDFGIMLWCLNELDYSVEWRVINAADYGMPQRRRRLYIFAYKNSTNLYEQMEKIMPIDIITKCGVIAKTFKVEETITEKKEIDLKNQFNELVDFSDNFTFLFKNTGYMKDGVVFTAKTIPVYKKQASLQDLLQNGVDESFFLNDEKKEKFEYMRSKKKVLRTSKSGFQYYYSEGAMSEYDDSSLPGRTMLTAEGTTNRSTHIIMDPEKNDLRILTPLECERLNQFPDNWTDTGMSQRQRYFMMGNALVCGVIKEFGKTINKIIDGEN